MESLFRLASLQCNLEDEMRELCFWLRDKVLHFTNEVPDSRAFFKLDTSIPCTATISTEASIEASISQVQSQSRRDTGGEDDVDMGHPQYDARGNDEARDEEMDVSDDANGNQQEGQSGETAKDTVERSDVEMDDAGQGNGERSSGDITNEIGNDADNGGNTGQHDEPQGMSCGDEEPEVQRHPEDPDNLQNGGPKPRPMCKHAEDEGLDELTSEGSEVGNGEKNEEEEDDKDKEEEEDDEDKEEEEDEEEDGVGEADDTEDGVPLRRSSRSRAPGKNTKDTSTVYSTQSKKPQSHGRPGKAQGRKPTKGRTNSGDYTKAGSSKECPILVDDCIVSDFVNYLANILSNSSSADRENLLGA